MNELMLCNNKLITFLTETISVDIVKENTGEFKLIALCLNGSKKIMNIKGDEVVSIYNIG